MALGNLNPDVAITKPRGESHDGVMAPRKASDTPLAKKLLAPNTSDVTDGILKGQRVYQI